MIFGFRTYQFILIIIAILTILYISYRVRTGKARKPVLYLWIFLWIIVFIFAFVPEFTNLLAASFGIARGLDFILLCGLLFCLLVCIKLYSKIDDLEHDVTRLVRELAIAYENKSYNAYENKKYEDFKNRMIKENEDETQNE